MGSDRTIDTDGGTASQRRLGRFLLGRRIAIGGSAEVYEASDIDSGQSVVVKVLLPQLRRDASFLQMLADEARLTTKLRHPNLVRTLATDGRSYLAMEWVDGCTLSQLIEQAGQRPLPVAVAFAIASSLLDALAYIHDRSDHRGQSLDIVHRDVTPRNVLLSRQGAVKLGDFGIARSTLRDARTRTGVIKGTVQYMAPEQATGDETDSRTDLYGVGLILFEMLTGQPFVQGDREVDLLREAERPRWRAPSSLNHELSESIDLLLCRALAPFVEQRYQSAETMITALVRITDTGPQLAAAEELAAMVTRVLEQDAPLPFDELGTLTAGDPGRPPRRTAVQQADTASRVVSTRQSQRRALIGLAVLVSAAICGWLFWAEEYRQPSSPSHKASLAVVPSRRDTRATAATPDHGVPDKNVATSRPVQTYLRRGPRSQRTRRHPAPDSLAKRAEAADANVGPNTPPALQLQKLQGRRRALLSRLAARELRVADLPTSARQQLALLRSAIARGDETATNLAVEAVDRAVARIKVDRTFVQKKLRYTDRKLRGLPAGHRQMTRYRQQATSALETFLDKRYAATNRQLNQLLDELATSP